MQNSFAARVYRTLNGEFISGHGVPGVESAFSQGSTCTELYCEAYDAYQRLCDRLGSVDEDSDIEIIFRSFMEISRILGIQMFHYGWMFHAQTYSPAYDTETKPVSDYLHHTANTKEEMVEME